MLWILEWKLCYLSTLGPHLSPTYMSAGHTCPLVVLARGYCFFSVPRPFQAIKAQARRKTTEHTKCLLGTHGRDRRIRSTMVRFCRSRKQGPALVTRSMRLVSTLLSSRYLLDLPTSLSLATQDLGHVSRALTWSILGHPQAHSSWLAPVRALPTPDFPKIPGLLPCLSTSSSHPWGSGKRPCLLSSIPLRLFQNCPACYLTLEFRPIRIKNCIKIHNNILTLDAQVPITACKQYEKPRRYAPPTKNINPMFVSCENDLYKTEFKRTIVNMFKELFKGAVNKRLD